MSEYVYGNGERVVSRNEFDPDYWHPRWEGATYYHQDVLGSTSLMTNEHGHTVERYTYDAFGVQTDGSFERVNEIGYTGQRYDPTTNMYNYGFRDYAPSIARFTTVDPIRDGNNWYAYVNNDPVNFVDPLGLLSDKPGDGEPRDEPTGIIDRFRSVVASIPAVVSNAAGHVGTAANLGTIASRLSTAAQATGGALSRIGGWARSLGIRAYSVATTSDIVQTFQGTMSPAELVSRGVAGASGFWNPAVGIVATAAVNSAFKGNPHGDSESRTPNTEALGNHFSFIDSLE